MKNITKISSLVIFALLLFWAGGCGHISHSQRKGKPPADYMAGYADPVTTGRLASDAVQESSGLAVSSCQPGVMWTLNDSGAGPLIYAFGENGRHMGSWKVTGAENRDWESMASRKDAAGECYLYIGDTGNNKYEKPEGFIYRIREPVAAGDGDGKGATETAPAERLSYRYPDELNDSEALLVHPATGDIYLVTKRESGPAGVYRLSPRFGAAEVQTAVKVAEVSLPAIPNGLVTGGDIAPDGTRVVLCDYFAGYELRLPQDAKEFDEIWRQRPSPVRIGERKAGETVAYSPDGLAIYATSEGKGAPIWITRSVPAK